MMKKTLLLAVYFFGLLFHSDLSWADQPLKIIRYDTKHAHAGKVSRIDFPPGFSVEYFYDTSGQLSKKKLYNFKHVIQCPRETPCELAPNADGFFRIVIDETIQGKISTIPSLLVVIERMHRPSLDGITQDLLSVWQVIQLAYLSATLEDKSKVTEQYIETAKQFEVEINSFKKLVDQTQYIFSDFARKMPTVETYEHLTLPKTFPVEGKELEKISTNLDRIGQCQAGLETKFREMLDQGRIHRERAVTPTQFNEVYPLVYNNVVSISQQGPAKRTVNIDLNWANQVGVEKSNRVAMILGDILVSQPRLMHTTRTILSVMEPVISISDRLMLYYPDKIQSATFSDGDISHKHQFLGDGNAHIKDIFGEKYAHYFEWVLAHELGHVMQNDVWFRKMELEKMSSLARIALNYEAKFKQNFIRPELEEKISKDLLEPLDTIVEQSASYFALDNLPCF